MKKIVKKAYLLGIILLAAVTLKAQEPNTFYVGYGVATHESISSTFDGLNMYLFTLGNVTLRNEKYSGAIFAGYRKHISKHWEIGGLVAYENTEGDFRIFETDHRMRQHIYAVMGEIRYNYISRPRMKVYSGASAGLSLHNIAVSGEYADHDNEIEEAFHVDLIGVSVGQTFAPFISIGWGYKGLINIGLQKRF